MSEFSLLVPNDDGSIEVLATYSNKFAGAEAFVHELSVLRDAMIPTRAARLIEANMGTLESIAAWAAGRPEGEAKWLARKVNSLLSPAKE